MNFIRSFSKRTAEDKVRGDTERRTGVHTQVYEDSSRVLTKQFAAAAVRKRAINFNDLTLDNIGQWPLALKVGVFLGSGFIIIALGYWFLIQDHLAQFYKLRAQEVFLKTNFESKQRQLYRLPAYREQVQILKERFESMLKQLPAQNEMPGLLEEISKSGRSSGLKFELFAPQTEIMHDFYVELPIKISVRGTYFQLAVFVSRIAQMKQMITLHRLSISGLSPKDHQMISEDELAMNVTAKIYRYRAQ